jgi:hypothetical protein
MAFLGVLRLTPAEGSGRLVGLASALGLCLLSLASERSGDNTMPREFFDPSPEEQQIVLLDARASCKAERLKNRVSTATLKVRKSRSISCSIA